MTGRTLLTGFGPFGGVTNNPSERLVSAIADSEPAGAGLETLVLPVSFARATQLVASAVATGRYDLVLMLGVAVGAPWFRLETTARRTDNARIPDCDGQRPAGPAFDGGPDLLHATADIAAAAHALAGAGTPHALSDSAGGYVCNRAYYAALHAAAAHAPRTRCLFVHVPADDATPAPPGQPTMDFARQVAGVRALLGALRA